MSAVQVVDDASGTSTTLCDEVTYDRLRHLGVVVTTTHGVLFELYPDLSTAEDSARKVSPRRPS